MSRRLCLALMLLSLPGLARAQETPERLLPATTQLYFRFDGLEPHRAGFDRTALGKTLQGDSGKFLTSLWTDVIDGLADSLTVPQLLSGTKPETLKQLQTDAVEAPKLLQTIEKNGLIVAAEVREILPPQYQVAIIVPGAGKTPAPFLGAVRLLLSTTYAETKERTIDGTKVWHYDGGPLQLVWWIDGPDGIAVLSSDKPEDVLKRCRDKTNRISDNAQFKKLAEFKQFETLARGYLDGASVSKLASQIPVGGKLIGELGFDGLKSARMWSGIDGLAGRSLIELDLPSPRKGIFKINDVKPFTLADLPPLPSDMTSVAAVRIDPATVHDATLLALRASIGIFEPEGLKEFDDGIEQFNQAIGLKLRDDLLAQLGDLLVVYSSPAEGPLGLGHTFCFRVKDEKKLQKSLEQALRALAKFSNLKMEINKKNYHGVDLYEASFREQGFFFLPTWTIQDGWLAVSYYPQAVQGFILRKKGELPSWKPDEGVQATLAKLPKEFTSLAITDPRPSLKSILSLAPMLGQLLHSFSPETKFDVGSIPNAHEATRHLFPNVGVSTDDGTTIRFDNRTSLLLPFEFTGLDTYSMFFLFAYGIRF